MPGVSFSQLKTWAVQDQSKAWPEPLLGQPEQVVDSPKTWTTTRSRAKPWAEGRAG